MQNIIGGGEGLARGHVIGGGDIIERGKGNVVGGGEGLGRGHVIGGGATSQQKNLNKILPSYIRSCKILSSYIRSYLLTIRSYFLT